MTRWRCVWHQVQQSRLVGRQIESGHSVGLRAGQSKSSVGANLSPACNSCDALDPTLRGLLLPLLRPCASPCFPPDSLSPPGPVPDEPLALCRSSAMMDVNFDEGAMFEEARPRVPPPPPAAAEDRVLDLETPGSTVSDSGETFRASLSNLSPLLPQRKLQHLDPPHHVRL